jgi:hypothetical protein
MSTRIPQPPISEQLGPRPERIRIGIEDILERIVTQASERTRAARVPAAEKQHLNRIADLARELRKEIRQLAALREESDGPA